MHVFSPVIPSCQHRFATKCSLRRKHLCLGRRKSHHTPVSPTCDPIRRGMMFNLGFCIHDASSETPSSPSMVEDAEQALTLKWFERPCKWETVGSVGELEAALSNTGGKYIAVDFFAGWCSSCKGAFPALCKIPNDPDLATKYRFLKANIEDEDMYKFVKRLSAAGIPFMAIYNDQGQLLLGCSASFKKITQVKANLAIIAQNPGAKRFVQNPQGVAEPA